MKVLKKIVLLMLVGSLVLLTVNLWSFVTGRTYQVPPSEKLGERYEPALIRLNSIGKMEDFIDSIYHLQAPEGKPFDTISYLQACRITVQKRFYHGVSEYRWSNNWPAWLSGNLCWSHMKAIVDPDDILKYSHAMCSQQQIVFLELLSRKKIPFRSVGLGYDEGPGHFISEVYYNRGWHMFDVNLEPRWEEEGVARSSFDSLLRHPEAFYLIYKDKLSRGKSDKLMTRVVYGTKNELPAGHMQLFHRLCMAMMVLVPVFLWFIYKRM